MFTLAREEQAKFRWNTLTTHSPIRRPEDMVPVFEELAAAVMDSQEVFMVATLDTRHRIISAGIIHLGTLNASLVHPREVFKQAVLDHAAAVIVCHNHPSGNPKPSTDDSDLTARLSACGDLFGITLLDHIIIAPGGKNESLREWGWPDAPHVGALVDEANEAAKLLVPPTMYSVQHLVSKQDANGNRNWLACIVNLATKRVRWVDTPHESNTYGALCDLGLRDQIHQPRNIENVPIREFSRIAKKTQQHPKEADGRKYLTVDNLTIQDLN